MKQVKFPIIRNVKLNDLNRTYKLDKGDVVKCWYCKKPIKISSETCSMLENDPSGMVYVDCPKCQSKVAVLYYFDQVRKK